VTTFEELRDCVRPRFDGEPIDYLLRRLKKVVNANGTLSEAKHHRYATTRSERKRWKRKAAAYKRQREISA
jgi:ribosomal protein S21